MHLVRRQVLRGAQVAGEGELQPTEGGRRQRGPLGVAARAVRQHHGRCPAIAAKSARIHVEHFVGFPDGPVPKDDPQGSAPVERERRQFRELGHATCQHIAQLVGRLEDLSVRDDTYSDPPARVKALAALDLARRRVVLPPVLEGSVVSHPHPVGRVDRHMGVKLCPGARSHRDGLAGAGPVEGGDEHVVISRSVRVP